jgi:hypothetical protein
MEESTSMTKLLERAFEVVQKLPDSEQDAIAAIILDELADEQQWDAAFARSQGALAQLAEKAREDRRAGRVKQMGFDDL